MKTEVELLSRRISDNFVKAFTTYHLLQDGDRVLVGLSGGKDSLCLLEMMVRRARIRHPEFSVEAIHVRMDNVDYEASTDYLQTFCRDLEVRLHVVHTRFEPSDSKPACFLCSWNRRKQMFNLAQELGCNKIALGHHKDDLIYTALMNLTFQGRFSTMPAILHMRRMPLSIIRPLCFVDESDIARYAQLRDYRPQVKRCPHEDLTNRHRMTRLLADIEAINPEARYSIWKAILHDDIMIQY